MPSAGRNHGVEKCSAICLCAIHDIERRATDAASCRWSARQPAAIFHERKANMLAHQKRTIALVMLLIFGASWLNASGKKMWTVSVAKLGYRGDAWRTIVRWRGNYIVIGSVKFIPDPEKNQCVVSFDPQQPLLVFDVAARKQVPAEVLGSLEQEWEPPHTRRRLPCSADKHGIPETWILPLTDDLDYRPDYEKDLIAVLDKSQREKYRISPAQFGCWSGCVTSSRAGNRFAILDEGQTVGGWIIQHTENLEADDIYTDKKRIRVYDAQNGKKLYQVSWAEPTDCRHDISDMSERVAFSDDGDMLAILDDEGVLRVVRISEQ
jgi:hypothetical protein